MSTAPVLPECDQTTTATLAELEDGELVGRALEGDNCAFAQLVERHGDRLRANVASIVTGADLDDVSQRAWIKIYEKLDTLRQPGFFYAWANRVMVNTALEFVRKRGRRSTTDYDDLPRGEKPVDPSAHAAERARWRELLEKTREWFDELEDRDQKMFRLFVVEGMTMAQIGEEVDMSAGGVKTRLFRAREQLRARREDVTP